MRVRTLERDVVGIVGLHRNRDCGVGINVGNGVDAIGARNRTIADGDIAHGIAVDSRNGRGTSSTLLDLGGNNKLNVLAYVVGRYFLVIERNLGRNVVRIHDLGVVEVDRLVVVEDDAAKLALRRLDKGLAFGRLAYIVDNRFTNLDVGSVADVALLIAFREIGRCEVGRIAGGNGGILGFNLIAGNIKLDDLSGNVCACALGGNVNLRYIRAKVVHAVGNDVARIPKVRFRCSLVLPPVRGR